MRVLRLCSVFEPPAQLRAEAVRFDPVGGMQTHTGELTRALDARGVQQIVVTSRPPGFPGHERLGEHSRVIRLGWPIRSGRQLYAVPAAWVVPRAAAGADLLHVHVGEDLAAVPIAYAAARLRRIPLVLTVHTSVAHTLVAGDWRSATVKRVGGVIERWGSRGAAAVIALTPRLAGLARAGGVPGERVVVIPSGVREALFTVPDALIDPVPDVPRPRVLFLGRLHRQKGVDTLLAAVAKVPDVRLVVAGDGPLRGELERRAVALGIADRVRWLGFVAHDDVPALLRSADVLAMPSTYEELGTALVEAMYAGLPIVASRTGGIPDLVTDGADGLLVGSADPDALAGALERLLRQPDLAARLGAAAARRVRDYRWDRLADRVLEVYRTVLNDRDRP